MKGPGFRIDLDVRRVWRCPGCGRIARTSGGVTSQRCRCADDGTWMQLQPPVKREPFRPPPRSPEDREPDEDDLPAGEPLEVAPVSDAIEASNASPADLSATSAAEAIVVSVEVVETAFLETPTISDATAPAPQLEVVEPQPAPLPDGFGAGVAEPLPSTSPSNETPPPPA